MRLKQGVLIFEAIVAIVLSSINVSTPINTTDIQQEEECVMDVMDEIYVASISDRIYHFENEFKEVNQKAWVIQKTNLQAKPYANTGGSKTIIKYSEITLTGTNDYDYWRVAVSGNTYYINKNCITTDYQVLRQVQNATKQTPGYYGPRLTASRGTITGPSGKETYYNLYMGNIVTIMRRYGNNDIYWIRDDGVKMLGDYVMVAASLDIRPRGSLVPTSLGMGIVCDTGGFALTNKTQLDIAVNWQIIIEIYLRYRKK